MKHLKILISFFLLITCVSCKNAKSNFGNPSAKSFDLTETVTFPNSKIDDSVKTERNLKEFVFDQSVIQKIKENGVQKTYFSNEISGRKLSISDDMMLKVYYISEEKGDLNLITGVLFYLMYGKTNYDYYIGSYSNEFGLLDSNNQIIEDAELSYNKSFFQENVKGIDGESFLKSPLRLSALVKYNDNLPLCNSDCTDFLDIDMEKRSIKRWFPEF